MGIFGTKDDGLAPLAAELEQRVQELNAPGRPILSLPILLQMNANADKIAGRFGEGFIYQIGRAVDSARTYEQARAAYDGQPGYGEYFEWQKSQTADELKKLLGLLRQHGRTQILKKF
ncbi:MAG: hypothetical protein HYT16_03065 [DPANN group archaeon]|nr:hypothetical protein [DPANN group archaeon]